MVSLRAFLACFCIFGACLSWAGTKNQIFHLIDVNSRDYKITDLVIEYSDSRVSEGFRIMQENQPKLLLWSAITSVKIETSGEGGTPRKYVNCSVELVSGGTLSLSCLNGTVLGVTRNGDYKKPLDEIIELRPVRFD